MKILSGVQAGCRGLLLLTLAYARNTSAHRGTDAAACGCHDWFHELGVHRPRQV